MHTEPKKKEKEIQALRQTVHAQFCENQRLANTCYEYQKWMVFCQECLKWSFKEMEMCLKNKYEEKEVEYFNDDESECTGRMVMSTLTQTDTTSSQTAAKMIETLQQEIYILKSQNAECMNYKNTISNMEQHIERLEADNAEHQEVIATLVEEKPEAFTYHCLIQQLKLQGTEAAEIRAELTNATSELTTTKSQLEEAKTELDEIRTR